jgi:hypothetical protein
VKTASTIYQRLVAVNSCNAHEKVQLNLFTVQMDREIVAAHSANSKWTKTFPRRTLQIQNGRKLFRGALCKFKMDENFSAAYSANPKWTKTFPRCTLQIQNGRKTAKMAAHRFTPY